MAKFSQTPQFVFEKFLSDIFHVSNPSAPYTTVVDAWGGDVIGVRPESFSLYVELDEGYKKLTCKAHSDQWLPKDRNSLDWIYITIEDGDYYSYTPTPSSYIEISHNSGFVPKFVHCYNGSVRAYPDKISADRNKVYITFPNEFSGNVVLRYVDSYAKLYAKKGEEFYNWLNIANNTEYKKFINTNRVWTYIGETLSTNQTEYSSKWIINHIGLKNFAIKALPEVNRTYLSEMILRYFFDRVYQQGYAAVENIKSLIDADEIPVDHLNYLAKFTNLNIDNYRLSEDTMRALVKSHIHLLKKKGTYRALEELWKMIVPNSNNTFTIYDRWHPKYVVDQNLDPSSYFIDFPWTQMYDDMDGYLQTNNNLDFLFSDGNPWTLSSPVVTDLDSTKNEVQKMAISSTHWLIYTKNEYAEAPQLFFVNEDLVKMVPGSVTRVDKRFFKASFGVARKGYVFINTRDTTDSYISIYSNPNETFINSDGFLVNTWHTDTNDFMSNVSGISSSQFLMISACCRAYSQTGNLTWKNRAKLLAGALDVLYGKGVPTNINELYLPHWLYSCKNSFQSQAYILNYVANFEDIGSNLCQAYIPPDSPTYGQSILKIYKVFDSSKELQWENPFAEIINGVEKTITNVLTNENGTYITCDGSPFTGKVCYLHSQGNIIPNSSPYENSPCWRALEDKEIDCLGDIFPYALDAYTSLYEITNDETWNTAKAVTRQSILTAYNISDNRDLLRREPTNSAFSTEGTYYESDRVGTSRESFYRNPTTGICEINILPGVGIQQTLFGRSLSFAFSGSDTSLEIELGSNVVMTGKVFVDVSDTYSPTNRYISSLTLSGSGIQTFTKALSGFTNSSSATLSSSATVYKIGVIDQELSTHKLYIGHIRPLPVVNLPYSPGVPPYKTKIRNSEIIDYEGNPGVGHVSPSLWSSINAQTSFVHTTELANAINFLYDSQVTYHTEFSILGPFIPSYVWNRYSTLGLTANTWTFTWVDEDSSWGGNNYRAFASVSRAAFEIPDSASRTKARTITENFLTWAASAWGSSDVGPPTNFNSNGSISTEIHNPMFVALLMKGAMYSFLDGKNISTATTIITRGFAYLQNRYVRTGKMKGTWCSYSGENPIWYGSWHAEILDMLTLFLEKGTTILSSLNIPTATILTWLDESDTWIEDYTFATVNK